MADILSADELASAKLRNLRHKVNRVAVLDNDAITSTVISDRVMKWNKLKFEAYNKHPDARGNLWIPFVSIQAENSDGAFDPGGTYFPNGRSDFESTTLLVIITVDWDGTSGSHTVLNFTGNVREPELDPSGYVNLVAEHPMAMAKQRIWVREDRIGGDTGLNASFSS